MFKFSHGEKLKSTPDFDSSSVFPNDIYILFGYSFFDVPQNVYKHLHYIAFLFFSSLTDIHIHVTNVNEFSPEFSQTSYTIYVQPNTLVGTSVLSVSADDLDADLDTDKEFFYTLDQSTLPGGTEYFHIDQKGRIYLVESLLAFSLGDALGTFTTVVTNPGNPVMSGTANVEVIIPGSTTTAAGTTTDRNKGTINSSFILLSC